MAYSKSLAARVRQMITSQRGITEKRMFGGVVFLSGGNMLVCVWEDSLIARLGTAAAEQALRQPYVRPFDATGRPMKGWVMIEPDGMDTDVELRAWIELAQAFVSTLPPK
jgi:hypothetical protein